VAPTARPSDIDIHAREILIIRERLNTLLAKHTRAVGWKPSGAAPTRDGQFHESREGQE